MSKGHSEQKTHTGRRTLGRCKSKTIEIIDIDKGKADVIIIDAPESSHQGSGCSRFNNCSSPVTVIRIDDEEGDIGDTPYNAGQDFSTNRAFSVFGNCTTDTKNDNDECRMFLKEGRFCSSMTGKTTMHPVFGSRNRYGLYPNYPESSSSESDSSECDTSESDNSDCEIMEDSSGLIREQWERAAFRKKKSRTVQVGSEDQASASGSSADPGFPLAEPTQNMVDLEDIINENCSEHLKGLFGKCGPSCSNSGTNLTSKTKGSELNGDPFVGSTSRKDCSADSDSSTGISSDRPSFEKGNIISESSLPRAQFLGTIDLNKVSTPDVPMQSNIHSKVDEFVHMEIAEEVSFGNSSFTDAFRVETSYQDQGGTCPGKPSEAWDGECLFSDSVGFQNQKEDVLYNQSLHEPPLNHEVSGEAKENLSEEQMHPLNEPLHDDLQMKDGSGCFDCDIDAIHGDSTLETNPETGASIQDLSLSKSDVIGDLGKQNKYMIMQNVPQIQSDITGEREKHKESEEYKRASAEEWESRKREIQIQAEEAQRLRKRRKAESLRLLDMEKRQKQRVEEIRESQRKDEETIHLKELFRAEVRRELDKMEGRFRDMASLLRGLGIHVEGGPFPLSHEVNAAYKQALLRFHPDRASRTDIRQQVEAEETFKMISRLKEKLLPVA
ncbi:hypothetical protein C4D60_Mb04t34970 [Musa balbisiana]|uniref:J domain-containing protein n=1 Tax=Musa balbisiana TaxID=52838 RepID=A0A4S8KHF7_MUSBA|nr:hypothetical protein C4D60_Mb04t34970 [Musa balbisiana]